MFYVELKMSFSGFGGLRSCSRHKHEAHCHDFGGIVINSCKKGK